MNISMDTLVTILSYLPSEEALEKSLICNSIRYNQLFWKNLYMASLSYCNMISDPVLDWKQVYMDEIQRRIYIRTRIFAIKDIIIVSSLPMKIIYYIHSIIGDKIFDIVDSVEKGNILYMDSMYEILNESYTSLVPIDTRLLFHVKNIDYPRWKHISDMFLKIATMVCISDTSDIEVKISNIYSTLYNSTDRYWLSPTHSICISKNIDSYTVFYHMIEVMQDIHQGVFHGNIYENEISEKLLE